MKGIGIVMIGLLSWLFGCNPNEPYQQRNGVWHFEGQPMALKAGERLTPLAGAFAKTEQHGYFRGSPVEGSEGSSFEVLSANYAKDRQQVYYCDTRRDSRDYFISKRLQVNVLSADAGSFRYLKDNYARDKARMFYEGKSFVVKDLDSFELLEYPYARDRVNGYFHQVPVPDSDGSSFSVIDSHYSKDHRSVYYSHIDLLGKPTPTSVRIEGAAVDSFAALESGYAKDAARAYHEGKPLGSARSFEVLSLGYSRTDTQVFYRGKQVMGADARSFKVLETVTDQADAKDQKASYQQGRRAGTVTSNGSGK